MEHEGIRLLPHCITDRQREKVEAYIMHKTTRKAGEALGISKTAITKAVHSARKRADGEHHAVLPKGHAVRGVSTHINSKGEITSQWIKSWMESGTEEAIRSFVDGLTENIKPAKPSKPPKVEKHDPDLLTCIPIGDAHIGMYAYGKETKHSDFDSDIATEQLRAAIDDLVDRALPTEIGMLIDVGDFIHSNGQNNTTYSGTPLDVDTRHSAVMKKAAMLMRYAIDKMLTKFKKVVVVVAKGNHDTDSAVAIRLAIDFYYSKDDRVNVLETHGFYHYIEYGKWLFGVTHGDKQTPEKLAGSMARDMAGAWGRTTHRLWLTGHFHKDALKPLPGVKVKVCAALPPPDSWHAAHGFAGDGEMEMMTFRKEGGLHSSYVHNIPQPRHEPDVRL